MSLLSTVRQLARRFHLLHDAHRDPHERKTNLRICQVEELETRRAMAVAPIHLGSVYYEEATGDDSAPDVIEVTFSGGAPGTQLTQLTINGDKDGNGLTVGDMFWDISAGGRGSFNHVPLTIVSSNGFVVNSITLVDGGTLMVIDATGWDAGEKLVISLDVDEQGSINSTAVAEGGEWEGSIMTGTFVNPNYETITGSVIYYDYFDSDFAVAATQAGSTLNLPPDNYMPPDSIDREDRTAGAVLVMQQIPKPIMLSGVVYHDRDQSVMQGSGEEGIAGVALSLEQWNGTSYVATGLTAVTNANGEYKFNGLLPGKYRVVESQPTGWLSTGSKAGTVNGATRGTTSGPDLIVEITLDGGETSIRNDFGEILPGRISGTVHADPEGDCEIGPNDIRLSGVIMQLLNPQGIVIGTTVTNAQGYYEFTNLAPGSYTVNQIQPTGYYDLATHIGSAGGVKNGNTVSQIILGSGTDGVNYDYCEALPGEISGRVWADPQGDCDWSTGGIPLSGVVIELLDPNGNVIRTTTTDINGQYKFTDLEPGTYGVRELQPVGYFQGGTHVGSAGGVKGSDLVTEILISSNTSGINYDFCENIPASLAGRVWVEVDMNCVYDPGEQLLSGVRIDLLDENGIVINTTFTNAQGQYLFVNLQPGKIYAVRETQPQNYFQGGTMAGSSGGIVPFADNINQIVLDSGEAAVNYDFCEVPQSKLSGYVFQDGPAVFIPAGTNPDIYATKTGIRGVGSIPIAGVRMLLGDINGNPVYDENGQPRITYTNAAGYYEFNGLRDGLYTVRQIQPDEYIDSIDTAGTTSGFAINLNILPGAVPLFVLADLQVAHNNDLIARINVPVGGASAENNFSEIRVVNLPPETPEPPVIPPPPVVYYPAPPYTPPAPGTPLSFENLLPYISPAVINRLYIDGTRVVGNTWHLSVIDAGQPRTDRPDETQLSMVSMLNLNTWKGVSLESTQWTLATRDGQVVSTPIFGNNYGIPVPGDYNGDGITEIAVYIKGEWFVDLNGNGKWDAEDLWAKLGTDEDLPVVGDWDGDGKDDIGIYGPAWPRDPEAIQREPGLPIVTNPNTGKSKNMPPLPEEATLGKRALKRSMTGKMRADLIDHVFNYGVAGDQPIAGDWTGQGSDAIGVFRNGEWHLDVNGDGKFEDNDLSFAFGQAGDKGLVGDWDGDGVDDLGVYRDGTFILDTNNNRVLDDSDLRVTPANSARGTPVAGDWDGDGRDEVGVMEVGKELPTKAGDN